MGVQAANLRTSHAANDSNKNLPHQRCPITQIHSVHRIKIFQQECLPYFPLTSTLKAEIIFIMNKKLDTDTMQSHDKNAANNFI